METVEEEIYGDKNCREMRGKVMNRILSAEYVSKGHPDKVADLISDLVLDEHLKNDRYAHVACETLISNKLVVIAGELRSHADNIQYDEIVKKVLIECGYKDEQAGFNLNDYRLVLNLNTQSEDINYGVNNSYGFRHGKSNCISDKMGAGDQGIVVGYACNETQELMPLPQMIARNYIEKIDYLRENKILEYLQPVSKALVTINYENRRPISIANIILSVQHSDNVSTEEIENDIITNVVNNDKKHKNIN